MLEVIKFSDGRYGIRNTWTGVVLVDKHGRIRSYKNPRRALRRIRKQEDRLAHLITSINSRSNT